MTCDAVRLQVPGNHALEIVLLDHLDREPRELGRVGVVPRHMPLTEGVGYGLVDADRARVVKTTEALSILRAQLDSILILDLRRVGDHVNIVTASGEPVGEAVCPRADASLDRRNFPIRQRRTVEPRSSCAAASESMSSRIGSPAAAWIVVQSVRAGSSAATSRSSQKTRALSTPGTTATV